MDIVKVIEIFALVTGVPYIILEVMQKNAMWYFGIATGLACAVSFAIQSIWASMGLNLYYVVVSFWGLYQWKKDSDEVASVSDSDSRIHLNHLSVKTALISLAVFVAGSAALIGLLHLLHDPMSNLDAAVAVMSAIATVWLGKSYLPHWFIWIFADVLSATLCFKSGMYLMTALYFAYTVSAIYGLFHWRRKGAYVD